MHEIIKMAEDAFPAVKLWVSCCLTLLIDSDDLPVPKSLTQVYRHIVWCTKLFLVIKDFKNGCKLYTWDQLPCFDLQFNICSNKSRLENYICLPSFLSYFNLEFCILYIRINLS